MDKLLDEIYSIEKKPELIDKYRELWKKVRSYMYKLEYIKSKESGLKKDSIFTYNNMFILDKKNNKVSTKKILSPLGSNFIKLRRLYNNYIKELNKITNDKKLLNKIYGNIHRTEIIINMLYLYGWSIDRIKNEKFNLNNYVLVYYNENIENLMSISDKLNNKKITSITLNIIKIYNTIIEKTKLII